LEGKNLRYEDLPDVLTVREMQQYLRIGKDKAYAIADQIPHFRSGNRRLFPKEKVKEWALNHAKAQTRAAKRLRALG